MGPTSRDDAVEEVRARTDIVALIGRYLKLKKVGSRYVGLCPFHAEKTPSFSVNPQRGFFHCFGCKASGDVFSFVMRMEGKTFPEALEDLAEKAGVSLPAHKRADPQVREQRRRGLDLLELACAFYERCLWTSGAGEQARRYLRERGLGEDIARRFRLGFAPPGWQNLQEHLQAAGAPPADAIGVGLLLQGRSGPYDFFRNRLIFPVVDLDDRVHGFGGRKMDPDDPGGKYINSSQGPLYDKSRVLYGLAQARADIQRSGRVVLVEGYFDVLIPTAHGVEGVVASSGTALTQGHAQVLKRFCDRAITVFDADAAGAKATYRAAEVLLEQDISPYLVTLPAGQDPDSFVRGQGGEAFADLIEQSRPSVEVLAGELLAEAGADVEARTRAVRKLMPILTACRDRVRRSAYLRSLAERFRIDERELRLALQESRSAAPRPDGPPPRELRSEPPDEIWPEDELYCLALVVQHPHLLVELERSGALVSFRAVVLRRLLEEMIRDPDSSPEARIAQIEDGALKTRLSATLVKEQEVPAGRADEALAGCVRKIRAVRLRAQERDLQERIARAAEAGQEEELRSLQRTKLSVAKELKALGVAVKTVAG
ncbi:MAG: DNA primase [Deltaproteobacteria bacterium]|nr:DNA primase [Deltaproteobacteria bacterium]